MINQINYPICNISSKEESIIYAQKEISDLIHQCVKGS
jgi:hypothetical protein